MIKTEVDASGMIKRMKKINKNLDDLPWLKVGAIAKDSVEENFDSGGGDKKWIPRKVNEPWPILIKSGRLRNSIYTEKIKDGVTVGSRVPYQAVHEFGYPKGGIPARSFLEVQNEDLKMIKKLIIKDIKK